MILNICFLRQLLVVEVYLGSGCLVVVFWKCISNLIIFFKYIYVFDVLGQSWRCVYVVHTCLVTITKTVGSKPKLVNFSLVGCLPLKSIKTRGLKRNVLMPLKWIEVVFGSFFSDFLLWWRATKASVSIQFPHWLIRKVVLWRIFVLMLLGNWLVGAFLINLLQRHFPSSPKSATVELLNVLLLLENCSNGPLQSQLSHKV